LPYTSKLFWAPLLVVAFAMADRVGLVVVLRLTLVM